jgi:hypothetical protein
MVRRFYEKRSMLYLLLYKMKVQKIYFMGKQMLQYLVTLVLIDVWLPF